MVMDGPAQGEGSTASIGAAVGRAPHPSRPPTTTVCTRIRKNLFIFAPFQNTTSDANPGGEPGWEGGYNLIRRERTADRFLLMFPFYYTPPNVGLQPS